jgi:hypothetical protein
MARIWLVFDWHPAGAAPARRRAVFRFQPLAVTSDAVTRGRDERDEVESRY